MAMSTRGLRASGHLANHGSGLRPSSAQAPPRSSFVARASPGEGNWFQKFLDFESWAPRSSRMWRLNQYDYESSVRSTDEEIESVAKEKLDSRLGRAEPSRAFSSMEDMTPVDLPLPFKSFSEAEDVELASALSQRIQQISSGISELEEDPAPAPEPPLTAEELRALVFTKYGKNYDLSLVRRDIPGKTFVSLNVMWSYLQQRSFKLTEEQYMEKLDSIAYLLNAVGQAGAVRAQLRLPAKSQNGMPARPVVGTAISIKLTVSEAIVEQWFGRGYQ